MLRIAFLGLGAMGAPMARNLLTRGYPVTVWNRTPGRAVGLKEAGAAVVDTPRAAAEQADVIITMLADPAAVEATATGPEGLLAGARPGSVWVECSTIGPTAVHRFAALADQAGVGWLDAPVGGSVVQAEGASLRFLVGGEAGVLERVRQILDAMGESVTHCGPAGSGAAAKLVNNQLTFCALAAMGEARALGRQMGLDPAVLDQVILNSPGGAPIMHGKLPTVRDEAFEPAHFALKLAEKDLALALYEGAQGAMALPLAAVVHGALAGARAAGQGELDFSALVRHIAKVAHR